MAFFFSEIKALHAQGLNGKGQTIGHLDTGVDPTHPALHGKVRRFQYFTPDGLADRTGEAFDADGHGTQTAGLLVGEDIGVAPAAQLAAGAVIEAGNVVARLLLGLEWILRRRVGVVYCAVGIHPPPPALLSMMKYMRERDILVVAPIGNSGVGRFHAPACYPDVLGVGAIEETGRIASFSGSENEAESGRCLKPEIAAPGVGIRTTHKGGAMTAATGTSVAAACVAGLAAILRQAFPEASVATIRHALTHSADTPAEDQTHRIRWGQTRPRTAFEILASGATGNESWVIPDPAEDATRLVIDERLQNKLEYGGDGMQIDVVLEFRNHAAAVRFQNSLKIDEGVLPSAFRCRFIRYPPICIMRTRVDHLRNCIRSPHLKMAAAADFDRTPFFL